jgi:hypothetical protein
MRSARRGESTSAVEVTNISGKGFWLLLDDRELFLAFAEFPWFRSATIAQIIHVRRPSDRHLYWPDLDVDLAVESLEHPERFPLVSRERPDAARRRRTSTRGKAKLRTRPTRAGRRQE